MQALIIILFVQEAVDILGAGIGRRTELEVGGADQAAGGGGYTGGSGESASKRQDNGTIIKVAKDNSGGSYFSEAYFDRATQACCDNPTASIGGQGGQWMWDGDIAGDGGMGGRGGTIRVSSEAKIYAYNGNKYTDYDTVESHKFDESTALENQTEIFAQNGILRAIYKWSLYWNQYDDHKAQKFITLFREDVSNEINNYITTTGWNGDGQKNGFGYKYLIRGEITETDRRKIKNGYKYPGTEIVYGVGSGAGYIELDNGTYTVN